MDKTKKPSIKRTIHTSEFKSNALARLKKEGNAMMLALELCVTRQQLYKWAKRLEKVGPVKAFNGPGRPAGIEEDELVKLQRDVERLKLENTILKKRRRTSRVASREVCLIHMHFKTYPVAVMCRLLKVSRSGCYASRNQPESKRSCENVAIRTQIEELHEMQRRAQSAIKMWHLLRANDVECGRNRVARLRRIAGIETRRIGRFRNVSTYQKSSLQPMIWSNGDSAARRQTKSGSAT
jgi:transposase-like protein